MSAPRRLMDEGTALERSLLEAAALDAPTATSKRNAALALGLAVAPLATGSTATAVKTAAGLKGGAFAKLATVLAIGGAITVAAVQYRAAEPPVRVAPSPPSPPATQLPPPPEAEPTSAPVVEAPVVATIPVAPARPRRSAVARPRPVVAVEIAPTTEVAEPVSTLMLELTLLDQARAALRAGQSSRALDALAEHARQFPQGVLATEAEAMRIEALLERGDRSRAIELADAFFAAHPASPLGRRLRSLLEPIP